MSRAGLKPSVPPFTTSRSSFCSSDVTKDRFDRERLQVTSSSRNRNAPKFNQGTLTEGEGTVRLASLH
jgi:hypothetical protein